MNWGVMLEGIKFMETLVTVLHGEQHLRKTGGRLSTCGADNEYCHLVWGLEGDDYMVGVL